MVNLKSTIEKFKTAGEVLGQNGLHASGTLGGHFGLTQIQAPAAAIIAPQNLPTLGL